MAYYKVRASPSTTQIPIPELSKQQEQLHQQTMKYTKSMEGLCQRKEELAKNKYQEKLEALAAKKDLVSEFKSTIATIEEEADTFDHKIQECKEELALVQEGVIDLRRRNTRNITRLGMIRELTDHIDHVEDLIYVIIHGNVTQPIFLKNLDILHDKIGYLRNTDGKSHWHKDSQCSTMCTIYEKLRSIAILKVAKFIASHISQFCRVMVTRCELPEDLDTFLKYYQFIQLNEPDLIKKMINKYIRYKQQIYLNHFKELDEEVAKLCKSKKFIETDPEKDHRIYIATDTGEQDEEEVLQNFTIGGRTSLFFDITEFEMAIDDEYYFEDIFKNFHLEVVGLIDMENKFFEVIFLYDPKERSDFLAQIMERTITFLSDCWKLYFGPMHDPITAFLCFHIVLRFRDLSHLNEIKILDKYWDTLQRVTLHRFNDTIHLNVHSINNYDVTKYHFDFGAHYVVKRYAKYTAQLKRVHKAFPHPDIADLLNVLRKTVNDFCIRVAKSITDKRYEMVFLINCYQEIIDALAETFKDDFKDDVQEYIDQLPVLGGEYIQAILQHYHGDIIRYIDEVQIYAITGDTPKIDEYAPMAKEIIEDFNDNWESDLDSIHRNVLTSFKNIITGYSILKGVLNMYLHYVTTFRDLLRKSEKDLVNIMPILVELEKIRRKYQALDDLRH